MPTGYALQDPRQQLLDAAERVLLRDGSSALTGRSVTAEAGVAKGVLHRHFADFDSFVAELVRARIRGFGDVAETLAARTGRASVSANVADALPRLLDPVVLGLVPLVIGRDELRRLVKPPGRPGLPMLSEAAAVIEDYLRREQLGGRIAPDADVATSALSLIATGHLLLAGELGGQAGPPTEVVESILVGIEVRI